MAVRFIFGAMAQQRDRAVPSDRLQQPEGEFLTVILDRGIGAVQFIALKQFFAVAMAELLPFDPARLKVAQQTFARTKIGHPDIVLRCRHAPATKSCRHDTQSILLGFHRGKNGFRFDPQALDSC